MHYASKFYYEHHLIMNNIGNKLTKKFTELIKSVTIDTSVSSKMSHKENAMNKLLLPI